MEGTCSSPLPGHILTHLQPLPEACSETREDCFVLGTAWHGMPSRLLTTTDNCLETSVQQKNRQWDEPFVMVHCLIVHHLIVNAVTPESRPPFSPRRRRGARFWREAGYAKPLNPSSYSTYSLSLLLELAIRPTQQEWQLPLLWEARDRLHLYLLSVHNCQLPDPTKLAGVPKSRLWLPSALKIWWHARPHCNDTVQTLAAPKGLTSKYIIHTTRTYIFNELPPIVSLLAYRLSSVSYWNNKEIPLLE